MYIFFNLFNWALNSFPRAALINYRKVGGLQQQNLFSHNFGDQKSEIRVLAEPKSLTGSRGQSWKPLPASGYFWHSLVYGCTTPISDYLRLAFPLLPLVFVLCVLLRKAIGTGFRTHLDNPQSYHLETLKLVTSAKTSFFQIRSHSQALGLGCSLIFLDASF